MNDIRVFKCYTKTVNIITVLAGQTTQYSVSNTYKSGKSYLLSNEMLRRLTETICYYTHTLKTMNNTHVYLDSIKVMCFESGLAIDGMNTYCLK